MHQTAPLSLGDWSNLSVWPRQEFLCIQRWCVHLWGGLPGMWSFPGCNYPADVHGPTGQQVLCHYQNIWLLNFWIHWDQNLPLKVLCTVWLLAFDVQLLQCIWNPQLPQWFHVGNGHKMENRRTDSLLRLADEYWTIFHESSLCPFPFGLCSPTNPGWQNQLDHISEIYSNCGLCPPRSGCCCPAHRPGAGPWSLWALGSLGPGLLGSSLLPWENPSSVSTGGWMRVSPLPPPLLFAGRPVQLDTANHWFGFQAPLQRTETGPIKSGKVTQLLQRPGRPSGTSPCRRRDLPPPPRQSFPGALWSGAPSGNGENRAKRCGPGSAGPGGLCKFRLDFTPASRKEPEGSTRRSAVFSGPPGLSSQLARTLAALTPDTDQQLRGGKATCSRGSQTLGSAQAAPARCPQTVTSEPPWCAPLGSKQI